MPESTEERKKSQCVSGQENLVVEAFKTMVEVRLFSEKLSALSEKVDQNDKKHTAAIKDLREFFLNQNLVVVDSVGELKKSVDAISLQLKPMVNREEKAKLFILKWSIPIIAALLGVIIFGEKAKILVDIFKALS